MMDMKSGLEMLAIIYGLGLLIVGGVAYGLLRLLGWHPLTHLGQFLGI